MPGTADAACMHRALMLAEQGVGLASPNPTVGCVLVDPLGNIVGEGFHQYALRDHAEVVALREAGERARGATAYVTLEPCSHHGRTGPCADALIAAGVARVVVATLDANPIVRGHGIEKLKCAGVEVEVGLMQPEAQRLNDAFAKFIRTGLPYVTLKAALSSDGFIAPAASRRTEKAPVWLTGPEARAEVQRMRHAHDAVLTGIGTVLADDPLLTDRTGLPRRRPLLRVVLDTNLRTPLHSKLLEEASGDILIFTDTDDSERISAFHAADIQTARWSARVGFAALKFVLDWLGKLDVTSVLIEAGTGINTTSIAGDFVDRLVLFQSSTILGKHGVPPLEAPLKFPKSPVSGVSRFGEDECRTTTLRSYWSDSTPQLYP